MESIRGERTRSIPTGRRIFALAAILLVVAITFWAARETQSTSWAVARMSGSPKVASSAINNGAEIRVGQILETDSTSRARVTLGSIGNVVVEPNTRLRLLGTHPDDQRLALDRGVIQASTWAPPRIFSVETPTATAVDLGCEYRLIVDDAGQTTLLVIAGYVALESNERECIVPAAAMCQTRSGVGPGTPYSEYSSDTLRQALMKFDFEDGGLSALDIILSHSRVHDAITLWHLLSRVNDESRPRVYDCLASLIPPPKEVTRAGVLALDESMLSLWWEEFEFVPPGAKSQTSLWQKLWYGVRRIVHL